MPPQRIGLPFAGLHHIIKPQQIGISSAQPGFGILAPHIQAADSSCLLQQQATLLWLGSNDAGNPALADESRRMGAGGCIGKQQLHILGAHILAVDAVA